MSRGALRLPARRHRHPGAARANEPGDVLRCLLLAGGPEWVALDLATGALVRSRASGWPVVPADSGLARRAAAEDVPGLGPLPELSVVEVELAEDDEPADPARPEAVMIRAAPALVGTLHRRAVRRVLKELLPADSRRPLLGSLGPSISYEDLDGSRPSVTLVAPDRLPAFGRDANGTWCQFTLGGRKHRLPVTDARIATVDGPSRGGPLAHEAVTRALGGTPRFLVVALGVPRRGQSPKLVLSALPRP